MSAPKNPYAKLMTIATGKEEDNILMHDSSPTSSKDSGFEGMCTTGEDAHNDKEQEKATTPLDEEEIDFEDNPFQIPPSFDWPITEETLCDDDQPYIVWASLCLPIPKELASPMTAVYDALEEFVTTLAEEDPHFIIYPHNLSKYDSLEDLLPPIETVDNLPNDIDNWLTYFPQAKPCILGSNTYTLLLIGLSIPFPKLVKSLSAWMHNKHFSLWKAYLQLEQPTSLGWLLFSTLTMDIELLKEAISNWIENMPIGFWWQTINIGSQGLIPKDQQVKALHIFVDELDVNMAKPLLMALYMSKTSLEYQFPLHICMWLVPKLDAVLNTKGWQSVDKLWACQNTWLSRKLIQIKMWEIELLDDESELLGLSLCDAMMTIHHPTNKKFTLFHTINKHFCEKCHVLMVLKSA